MKNQICEIVPILDKEVRDEQGYNPYDHNLWKFEDEKEVGRYDDLAYEWTF